MAKGGKGRGRGARDSGGRPGGGGNGSSFSSFEALRRAQGGGEAPAEGGSQAERGGKGWVLETEDDLVDADAPELADLAPGVREIIESRPPGFGPMTSGPPAYRDVESEEMELLHSFRIRTVFPEDVLAEVRELPADPREEDFRDRVDLRDHEIFTVDGDDAKDYDDAIEIRDLGGGAVEVGVHIADVGHYVRPGTALDAEALTRATSVYLPDQVIPMLPEELSNGLCSLVPERPRLAYSVYMTYDAKGKRQEARVHKSVIRSVRRNTYREVQELLDGEDTEGARALAPLGDSLRRFERWARQQQKLREAAGAMRVSTPERKFVFDENWNVVAIVDAPRYFSMSLIEETALAANQAVGDLFHERGLPTIYRVHPEKDPEEVERVAKLLAQHGLRVPKKERLTGRDISRLIRAARRKPNADALIQRIMGLVERAVYEVRDREDVAEHFGLAKRAYLHFTSPIRRYPDLVVHRWLWSVESRGEAAARELECERLLAELNDTAAHCSMRAEIAEMASRAVGDLKVCQFIAPHIGEKVEAKVRRVSPAGLEVDLVPFHVTAFLPTRVIGERATVEGPKITIRKGRTYRSFSEGQRIVVKITDVDFLRLQVLLGLP